MIDFVYVECHM